MPAIPFPHPFGKNIKFIHHDIISTQPTLFKNACMIFFLEIKILLNILGTFWINLFVLGIIIFPGSVINFWIILENSAFLEFFIDQCYSGQFLARCAKQSAGGACKKSMCLQDVLYCMEYTKLPLGPCASYLALSFNWYQKPPPRFSGGGAL